MTLEQKINGLSDRHLADVRAPDITGFVDDLFRLAMETGALNCALDGKTGIRFSAHRSKSDDSYVLQHAAAKAVIRMMCARISVLCKESGAADVAVYGDSAELELNAQDHRRWNVSFTNTAERREFSIEAIQ